MTFMNEQKKALLMDEGGEAAKLLNDLVDDKKALTKKVNELQKELNIASEVGSAYGDQVAKLNQANLELKSEMQAQIS